MFVGQIHRTNHIKMLKYSRIIKCMAGKFHRTKKSYNKQSVKTKKMLKQENQNK